MLLNPHWSQPLNMPSWGFTFKSMDFTTRKKKKIPFPILLWIAPPPPLPISILNNFLSPGGFHCALLGSFSALIMNPSICLYKARRCGSVGQVWLSRTAVAYPRWRLFVHSRCKWSFPMILMGPDHVTFECVLSYKLLLQSQPDK